MMAKRGHLLDGLMDIGLWYVLLVGLPMLVLPATAPIGKVLSIVGALGLILTQGRHEKNIFMKLIKGVMSLYDITSYLSDVLSLCPYPCFGTCRRRYRKRCQHDGHHAGIKCNRRDCFRAYLCLRSCFQPGNQRSTGACSRYPSFIVFEFFGKFYEAGGKPFKPFKANTKYTLISDKEDM